MEMERIQSEIDQAIHNTDSSNKTAENLKKEIVLIENAIAEKKRQVGSSIFQKKKCLLKYFLLQVEQLVNEMKEVNLQSLTVTTSEEIKHLLEGKTQANYKCNCDVLITLIFACLRSQ